MHSHLQCKQYTLLSRISVYIRDNINRVWSTWSCQWSLFLCFGAKPKWSWSPSGTIILSWFGLSTSQSHELQWRDNFHSVWLQWKGFWRTLINLTARWNQKQQSGLCVLLISNQGHPHNSLSRRKHTRHVHDQGSQISKPKRSVAWYCRRVNVITKRLWKY